MAAEIDLVFGCITRELQHAIDTGTASYFGQQIAQGFQEAIAATEVRADTPKTETETEANPNYCKTCNLYHPNGWACPKEVVQLRAQLEIAIEDRRYWKDKAEVYGKMVHGCAPLLADAGHPVDASMPGGAVKGIPDSVRRLVEERDDHKRLAEGALDAQETAEKETFLLHNKLRTCQEVLAGRDKELAVAVGVATELADLSGVGDKAYLVLVESVKRALDGGT